MKCSFCAEEIKDAARICRFCGATKEDGQWQRPTPVAASGPKKSYFNVRFAAVCFAVGMGSELFNITAAVPLFGALQTGAIALLYHLVYVAIYGGLAYGLWRAAPWAPRLVLYATLFYSLDSLVYLNDNTARAAELGTTLTQFEGLVDTGMFLGMLSTARIGSLAGWWLFAVYIYFRRHLFSAHDQGTS